MPFCPTDTCDACGCCTVVACGPDESKCHETHWICVMCGAVDPDYDRPDDGLPPGWGQNADGDEFCAACLKPSPLDPPEDDH